MPPRPLAKVGSKKPIRHARHTTEVDMGAVPALPASVPTTDKVSVLSYIKSCLAN